MTQTKQPPGNPGRFNPHIPLARIRETTRVLRALGGAVAERIHAGLGYGITEDQLRQVRGLLSRIGASDDSA
jgi:phospholipase/carboxylesterase